MKCHLHVELAMTLFKEIPINRHFTVGYNFPNSLKNTLLQMQNQQQQLITSIHLLLFQDPLKELREPWKQFCNLLHQLNADSYQQR